MIQAEMAAPEIDLAIDMSVPDDRWHGLEGDPLAGVESAARTTFGQAAADAGGATEISIVFGDDTLVHGLNRDFRKLDRPTNVLSFALTDGADPMPPRSPGEPVMLGDVVLAYETVTREAREQSKSSRDHTLHLVVHGVLHLMGYDHETEADARVMERMERRVLAGLGIADPYLERPPPA